MNNVMNYTHEIATHFATLECNQILNAGIHGPVSLLFNDSHGLVQSIIGCAHAIAKISSGNGLYNLLIKYYFI